MNSAATGRALLLAALNVAAAAQGYNFSPSALTFSAVGASSNPNREVQVTYTAVEGSGFSGSEIAFYDRLDLTAVFTNSGIEVVSLAQGPTNIGELVAALNTRYGAGFTAEDFDLSAPIAEGETAVVLTALPTSYGFKGELVVSLEAQEVPLAEAVVNPELAGLQFTPVDSEVQA